MFVPPTNYSCDTVKTMTYKIFTGLLSYLKTHATKKFQTMSLRDSSQCISLNEVVLLFFVMDKTTSSTTSTVRVMERRVTSLKLADFQGENVFTAISQIRSVISHLSFLDNLPHDIVPKLLDVFQSSSITTFNDVSKFITLPTKIGKTKSPIQAEIIVLASTTCRES